MKFVYDPVREGDADGCKHNGRIVICFPHVLQPDVEGFKITVRCEMCNGVLEEGMAVE